MVKGVSRQVVVVHSPDQKLFEQAIFILRDDALGDGITDEALMREAKSILHSGSGRREFPSGPLWAAGGAFVTAALWALSMIL